MKVKLIAIAALGKSRQIGLRGGLPWKLPDEYEHFRKTVQGHYVLIGRKNFELHGCQVEGAMPLVITRHPEDLSARFPKARSIEEALLYLENNDVKVAYVIGGAEIYKLALPWISEFLWSEVDYDGPADTYFPEFQDYKWTVSEERDHGSWKFRRLEKKSRA